MSNFNLKAYWREILIAILIALLLWVSSADRPIKTIGNTDTVCITDTVTNVVPGATLVKYVNVKLLTYDTIIDHQITDHYITRLDTSWLYADVPVNEYRDTSYYARTIGWLDSISVYRHLPVTTSPDHKITRSPYVTIFANTQIGSGVLAPGLSMSVKRLQLGYNYDILQKGGRLTLGYRIR